MLVMTIININDTKKDLKNQYIAFFSNTKNVLEYFHCRCTTVVVVEPAADIYNPPPAAEPVTGSTATVVHRQCGNTRRQRTRRIIVFSPNARFLELW